MPVPAHFLVMRIRLQTSKEELAKHLVRLQNGIGHLLQDGSGSCSVVTCNAGYDNSQDDAQCQLTASGHFSLANDKARTACPTPDDASYDETSTGLSSAADCYSCEDGYLKNTTTNTCDFPLKGKYVAAGGTEADCKDITNIPNFNSWEEGAAADADSCLFSCKEGYVKSGRACNVPAPGKYADSSGVAQTCVRITVEEGATSTWIERPASTDAGCPFFL